MAGFTAMLQIQVRVFLFQPVPLSVIINDQLL